MLDGLMEKQQVAFNNLWLPKFGLHLEVHIDAFIWQLEEVLVKNILWL